MYTYQIFDDGYDILYDKDLKMTQREPYAKVFDPEGSYEDNAKIHISKLTEPCEEYSLEDILPIEEQTQLEMQMNIQYLVDLVEINNEEE